MKFTQIDLIHIENLMKASRKAHYQMSGDEVFALSDCLKWLTALHKLAKIQVEESQKPEMIINPAPISEDKAKKTKKT